MDGWASCTTDVTRTREQLFVHLSQVSWDKLAAYCATSRAIPYRFATPVDGSDTDPMFEIIARRTLAVIVTVKYTQAL